MADVEAQSKGSNNHNNSGDYKYDPWCSLRLWCPKKAAEVDVAALPRLASAEIQSHNTADDCWIVYANTVLDVTDYLASHPGGADNILEYAGADCTRIFDLTGHSENAHAELNDYIIGTVADPEVGLVGLGWLVECFFCLFFVFVFVLWDGRLECTCVRCIFHYVLATLTCSDAMAKTKCYLSMVFSLFVPYITHALNLILVQ